MKKQTLVIGIGGGAQNILNQLSEQKGNSFNYIAINSDEQILKLAKTNSILFPLENRVFKKFFNPKFINKFKCFCNFLLCPKPCYGCGGNAEIGENLAQKYVHLLKPEIQQSKQIFVISTFGGGFGTGATPIVVNYIKQFNVNLIAIITTPFSFEGKRRTETTKPYIEKLRDLNKNLIILQNDELIKYVDEKISFKNALQISGDVIIEKVLEISKNYNSIDSLAI